MTPDMNFFQQCPEIGVPSRSILLARNEGDAYATPEACTTNGLRHGTQFGVPVWEELVTVCVGMRVG